MLYQYETVFIINPLLSEREIKKAIKGYIDFLKKNDAKIVYENNWGMKQLAYPIKNKHTGYYYLVEFQGDSDIVAKLELQYKRDENILRFLTNRLDKYAIEYNERKRSGKAKTFDEIKETQGV